MPDADIKLDRIYDGLIADFGNSGSAASGYRSNYSFLRERAMVLEVVGDEPGTVVDLACGTGLVTLPLVEAGQRVIGVDFNAASCRVSRQNGLCVVRGDAFNLPLANDIADIVVNMEFAQQYDLHAVEQMLNGAVRVLRPFGRLVIVWGNRAALVHRVASPVFDLLDRRRDSFTLTAHAPSEIRTAAERAGLTLDDLFAIFPPLRLRLRRINGPLARLIGSSFVAVFRTHPNSQG